MSDLRTAAQQATALICSARLCEVNSMSSRQEMLRLLIEATDTLKAALAEPPTEDSSAVETVQGPLIGRAATDVPVPVYVLKKAEPVQEPQLKRIHPLDMPLEVFVEDLSTRPRNIINAEMGYFTHLGDEYIKPPFTVRHLLMFSRKELRKWPNLGKRSLNEIEEMLRNRGLQLWDEHDERSLRLLREHSTYFRAALAEPPTDWEAVAADQAMTIAMLRSEEPVAWMVYTLDGKSVCVTDNPADFTDEHRVLPLYTAPPQRKED